MTSFFRRLRREPAFVLFAILTLALGIGASTAMFSVLHAVLLAPVPYADPDRVVAISTRLDDRGREFPRVSGGDWLDIEKVAVFDAAARYHGGEIGVQLDNRAEFAGTYLVTSSFFDVFGAQPLRGRLPREEDARRSVVIGSGFAVRAFGSVDHAIGRTVAVDNTRYEVIGVLPAAFRFPDKGDVWVVLPRTPENVNRTAYNYKAIAKLKPGVSLAAAQSALAALQLAPAKTITAVGLREQLAANVRPTLLLLLAAVALVLLISCANVAHLLLARAVGRTREFAIRAALGAGRTRLFSTVVAENFSLGIVAGLLGIAMSFAAVQAIVALAPANLPRLEEVQVSVPVLAFGVVLALLSTVLFGLAPAWHATRIDVQEAFRQAPGRGVAGGGRHRLRDALVMAEIAMSFALALGAVLLTRSLIELNTVDLGFRSENVLVTYTHLPARSLSEMKQAARFFETFSADLRNTPGVLSAAAAMGLPAGRYGSNGLYSVEGRNESAGKAPQAGFRLATPGYFATLGIPLLRGRDFHERDQYDSTFVAIVSESLVRQSFPGEDPIGKRVQCGLDSPKWMTIVGVVADIRANPSTPPAPELYMPLSQHPFYANEVQLAVRTASEPTALQRTIERLLRERNPTVAIQSTTLQSMLSDSLAAPRFRMFLVTVFAGLALLLAITGIYASMSYLVAQRTAEMGVRVALGATPASLMRLVLARAGILAASGLAAGLLLTAWGSRLLETLVFGIAQTDAVSYAVAIATLGAVALLAAVIPAMRAARTDPATALRQE